MNTQLFWPLRDKSYKIFNKELFHNMLVTLNKTQYNNLLDSMEQTERNIDSISNIILEKTRTLSGK